MDTPVEESLRLRSGGGDWKVDVADAAPESRLLAWLLVEGRAVLRVAAILCRAAPSCAGRRIVSFFVKPLPPSLCRKFPTAWHPHGHLARILHIDSMGSLGAHQAAL